jgi:RES domain
VSSGADPEPADAPGPPPLPPGNLASRGLPLHVCAAGTRLARIYSTARSPLFFGPAAGMPPRSRWDAPAGEFRVCYLAEEPHAAFAETFLRDPGATLVETADVARRALLEVEVTRNLRLVALHGPGLRRLGATAAVCTGPYAVSRAWALALHTHPSQPDGIRYRARHDDDGFAIALFDRAADAIAITRSTSLTLPQMQDDLAGWLDRYGMGLL